MGTAVMEILSTTHPGVHGPRHEPDRRATPVAGRTTPRTARRLAAALLCLSCLVMPASAQSGTGEATWRACDDALPWLHASKVPDMEPLLMELVSTGGLDAFSREWIGAALEQGQPTLDEAIAWAGQGDKLVLWYVPALEGQHMILTHLLDRYMMTGPLSHPAVIGVVESWYMPVKLPAGGELARRYGLTAPDVLEPALLVLGPSGEVLHRMDRIATFDGELVAAWLAEIARRHEDALTPPAGLTMVQAGSPMAPLQRGAVWLAAGRPDRARDALEDAPDDGPPQLAMVRELMLARCAFQERDGEAVHQLLGRLRRDAPAEMLPSVELLRGLTLLRQGRLPEAEDALRRARDGDDALGFLGDPPGGSRAAGRPGGPRPSRTRNDPFQRFGVTASEAGFQLGYALMHQGREDDAVAAWRQVQADHPDTLYAARAAAASELGSDGYRGESARARGLVDPRWLPDAAYEPGRDSRRGRDVDDAEEIARWGLSFLLLTQRQDGAWNGPRWGGDGSGRIQPSAERGTFHNIDTAIAAVAASALHRWRHLVPAAAAARDRAEAFLLRDDLVQRGVTTAWAYADALRLEHFAQRLPELTGDQEARVREAMARWIEELLLQQEELDGPFAHYVYTSTFATARVMLALERARDAGFEVDPAVFARAADVLAAARDPQSGLFGYLLEHPAVGRSLAGASARQPLCVLALRAAGREADDALPGAVATFLEGYEQSTERARLANFHIPSLGQTAGYFFFHDLYPATLAAREVPGDEGVALRRSLLEAVCALPEADGAFVDSGFSYGKAYGTAMALLCLDVLALR
jgi:tetratricopeptide (TPR) repeat protein